MVDLLLDVTSNIKKRDTFEHLELNTMVSSRGKNKGCLATFVKRKTRFYIELPMKNSEKDPMFQAICKLTKDLPKEALQTFFGSGKRICLLPRSGIP